MFFSKAVLLILVGGLCKLSSCHKVIFILILIKINVDISDVCANLIFDQTAAFSVKEMLS